MSHITRVIHAIFLLVILCCACFMVTGCATKLLGAAPESTAATADKAADSSDATTPAESVTVNGYRKDAKHVYAESAERPPEPAAAIPLAPVEAISVKEAGSTAHEKAAEMAAASVELASVAPEPMHEVVWNVGALPAGQGFTGNYLGTRLEPKTKYDIHITLGFPESGAATAKKPSSESAKARVQSQTLPPF
jgi:hypothetical protein